MNSQLAVLLEVDQAHFGSGLYSMSSQMALNCTLCAERLAMSCSTCEAALRPKEHGNMYTPKLTFAALKAAALSMAPWSRPSPSLYHARLMAKSIACCCFMHSACAAFTGVETSTPKSIGAEEEEEEEEEAEARLAARSAQRSRPRAMVHRVSGVAQRCD